jgi:phage terminase large subunit
MKPETIIIYTPRAWAIKFHNSDKRWKVILNHRRSGKTVSSINHLIRDAMRIPQSKWAYIEPTYRQSKDIVWDILKHYAGKVDGVIFNEGELRADFANGSRIRLYGADNPDSLRGIGLWGVIFDEYSQQPSNIFTEIIRPALADHKGYAIWIGTPKGKNDFYRLYQHAISDSDWLGMLLTVDDTGIISQEELDDSRKVMTEDEYRQEWYCSFEASIKGAYYAEELSKARKEKRITKIDYDNSIPVFTVWDLGVSDAMAIGFFQKANQEVRMIDYYESTDKGLDHYAKVLQEKGYVYGKHIAPHDIAVREMTTGKTRQEIAKGLGINFDVLPLIALSDGIHAGRMMFSRLWVDETKCGMWLDYIGQYRREWDDKRGMFKDNPCHDFTSNAADMYRYSALAETMFSNSQGAVLTKQNEELTTPSIIDGLIEEHRARKESDWRYQ